MGLFAKRMVPPTDLQTSYVQAPIGGINTIDVASEMPPTDAILCWNMVPSEYGLRARLGYSEWYISNTATLAKPEQRTVIPFQGTTKNGSTNRLFIASQAGIVDASSSSNSGTTLAVTFGTTTGEAGYGVFTMATTPGGRFGLYTDEENGLYEYSENSGTWTQAASGTNAPWPGLIAATPVLLGNRITANGNVYVCSTAGLTAATGTGPSGTGTAIADGTAKWDYVSAFVAGTIGPSLADQQLGYAALPSNFAAVCVWKNRVWLVEKNTTRAWYLGVNSVTGVATSFDFGSKMKAGGPLVNLYNWSYDGGSGMDTLLVGVSTAGDVVIYAGTDPNSAGTFGIKGTWSLGAVPYGRRIATDYGGDILVLALTGIIPLSKLVTGKTVVGEDSSNSVYATGKISNLFNVLTLGSSTLIGWALHVHPQDNTLLVLCPTATGQPTQQLAMSFATKGWGRYRGLPMMSAGVWNGQLYFGTADNRVCLNAGYLDNVSYDKSSSSPVIWSVITGYEDLGNANAKKIEFIIPRMLADSASPLVKTTALYDLNVNEPALPSGTGGGGSSAWDSATWDASLWAGDYNASSPFQSALGVGRSAAIAAQGASTGRTILEGFNVGFRVGGPL